MLGLAEGLSLLLLLFVAMPMRALTQDPTLVRHSGSLHGLLFIMYVYTLIDAAATERWPRKTLLVGLAMSSLPFGTFWFDRAFLKKVHNIRSTSS